MGYDMTWWRYKSSAKPDHGAVCDAIYSEKKCDLLSELPTDQIRAQLANKMPEDWELLDDGPNESTWEGKLGGAAQISWTDQYIFASMYGDFERGAEALDKVLSDFGLPRYDPQTGKRMGVDSKN